MLFSNWFKTTLYTTREGERETCAFSGDRAIAFVVITAKLKETTNAKKAYRREKWQREREKRLANVRSAREENRCSMCGYMTSLDI
jgi:nuclear transport factor 2 (NTF2) superfamily protein